jgi:trans-o-hydroxybenzylidenepyruvate hydratase-aldolase
MLEEIKKEGLMLTVKDINGIVAIMPTCAKPGADDWRMENSVDLDETARVVDQLIKDGAGVMLTTGTTGEAATLLWDELKAFAQVVVETTKKRIPLMIGATSLGTKETIRRTRAFMDMGANGIMLGIPMWQAPTFDEAVAHYKMVSEAAPNANIFAYANSSAFRFSFPPAFFRAIHKDIPQVIGCKFGGLDRLLATLEASDNQIRLTPVYRGLYEFAIMAPEASTACWTHAVQLGPIHAMLDALKKRDLVKAKEIQKDFDWASSTHTPPLAEGEFAQFNIQLEKIRTDAAGYAKAGPSRPPYHLIPANRAEGAKEAGRRWKQLAEKYSKVPA